MGNQKLLKDLSANTIQTGITQLAGLIIFYLMSRYISKNDFGAYNWSVAVGSTFIAIGSLGLDFVLVKKIAAGDDPGLMAGIHFFHTLVISALLLLSVLLMQQIFPLVLQDHPLFTLILVQLCITSIAGSFKFSLTGLEAFRSLAIVSTCLNVVKVGILVVLFLFHSFTIVHIVSGFIVASAIELLISYYSINKRLDKRLRPLLVRSTYYTFILESLPQLGVVLFDSALARIDWILLGIYSTVSITAEYSFAYKFFELSKLPLLILAPVLLTRFSRLHHSTDPISGEKKETIRRFFELELFIAFLIPIGMVCCWTDLIDLVTDNKYGAVNQVNYTILAFCVPLHFMINFYWTIHFVQGRLKEIMWITIGISALNTVTNIFFIPLYGSLGASISFLGSTLFQLALYAFLSRQSLFRIRLLPVLQLTGIAIGSVALCLFTFSRWYVSAITAPALYSILCLLTRRISLNTLKEIIRKP